MKICFYGVGGVGGFFGSLIANKIGHEHDIYFIARGEHKEAICHHGLTLKKEGGAKVINVHPKICTSHIEDIPVCDIIFVSVKSYDLPAVATNLNKIANAQTLILPLLNGIDINNRIRAHCKTGIILPACVYVGTHIESPGIIVQKGGAGIILLGPDPIFPVKKPEKLLAILRASEIKYSWEENVQAAIWTKFIFIAAFGLVTATYDKTIGEVLDTNELGMLTKNIMLEIEAIAHRMNIPIQQHVVDESFQKARLFPYHTKTSFQRDVEAKGQTNEGDLFGGTILRYGSTLGIDTKNTRETYLMLNRQLAEAYEYSTSNERY